MPRHRPLLYIVLLLLAFISMGLNTVSAFGQISASLSGRIMDPTRAAIPTATVTAKNTETGISRTALTNQSGRYQLLELPIGRYEVYASKAGFADEIRKGILLVVGQDATADLTLQVGAVKQQVTVNENVP
ncbi:MAG: carboxypeptidase-like regulatory domain-containing protein, partial [Terracidiphilus sp.]